MLIRTTTTPIPALIRIPCLNPLTGRDDMTINVNRAMLEDLEQNGPPWKFHNSNLISETVESPTVILQGLNRVGFQTAYCFSRTPSCRWIDERTTVAPRPYTVFVVFVSSGIQPEVLDWEWRMADPANPGYPKYWQRDFMRKVHP